MSRFTKIGVGAASNDGSGTPLRTGGQSINGNFDVAEAATARLPTTMAKSGAAEFIGSANFPIVTDVNGRVLFGYDTDSASLVGAGLLNHAAGLGVAKE